METNQEMALVRFGINLNQVVHKDGRYWLTAEQLGTALGYEFPRKSVTNIINRHRQELQPFIGGINLVPPSSPNDNRGGGPQQTTIIDTDGQYMIALLANTPKAADFRIFVVGMLKALERREFIPISQVLAWQEEQSRLFDYLALSKSVNLRKYRNFLRYRDMGLSNREIGKLLDVSEKTVRRMAAIQGKRESFHLIRGGAVS